MSQNTEPQKLKDSPTQAPEAGEPEVSGRQHGRVANGIEQPQAANEGEGNQQQHWESGRPDATPDLTNPGQEGNSK